VVHHIDSRSHHNRLSFTIMYDKLVTVGFVQCNKEIQISEFVIITIILRKLILTRVHDMVYTIYMKNITFSAKEDSIEKARKAASHQHRTLNELFREWLDSIGDNGISNKNDAQRYDDLWGQTNYLRVGKKLSREEMNER
jgi:hypothetical protein